MENTARLFLRFLAIAVLFTPLKNLSAQTTRPIDDLSSELTANGALRWSTLYQRDPQGFTIFPPGQDSRTILVSTSEGSDSSSGLQPVRTLKRALALVRAGHPDRILFKRGDTFPPETLQGIIEFSGRSAFEPAIIGSYGSTKRPRPVLEATMIIGGKYVPHFLILQGLDFYASTRDPIRPGFNPDHTAPEQRDGLHIICPGSYFWIEDCRIRNFSFGITLQGHREDRFHGFVLRRCQIVDCWDRGHSSGIYLEDVDHVLIEENIFDHNGWIDAVQNAGKNVFNHNMYIQHGPVNENRHMIVRGNISARAASHGCQLRAGGILEDNLFLDNPLAAFVAYAPSVVRNNVVLGGESIGPTQPRGRGLEFLNCATVLVEGNVVAHKPGNFNLEAAFSSNPDEGDVKIPCNTELRHNIVYDWTGPAFLARSPSAAMTVHENIFAPTAASICELAAWQSNYTITKNHYQPTVDQPFSVANQKMDLAAWRLLTGDASDVQPFQFVEPSRDAGTYATLISLSDSTAAGFLEAARQQRRGHWNPQLTAHAVNQYIRAGFTAASAN
jgi:hypothetical protein